MTRKAYLDDPWTTEFTARITGIGRDKGSPYVVFESTWFYPESGGQRSDRGTLVDFDVVDVREMEGTIRHVLDRPASPDMVGRELVARLDRERRFDHMQQHTGQHLLSAAFLEVLSAPTLSFHMGDDLCAIDLERSELTLEDAATVENRVNRVIVEDRPIRVLYPTADELCTMELRRDPAVTDRIRIVEIDSYDRSPCGGTHCERTGQVGALHIRRWERVRKKVRIHFMAGLRAVADHRTRNRTTLSLCAALSTRDSELEPRVHDLIERAKRQAKELEAAHEELVAFRAAALLESARWIGALRLVTTPSGSGAICRSLVQRLGREHDVVALAWSVEGDVALACGSGTAVDAGRLLKELIAARGGKGGGQPELAQGRVEPAELPGLALDLSGRLEAQKGELARLGRFSREHVTRDGMAFRVREALPSDAVGIAAYVRSVLQGRPMVRTQIEDFTITDDQLAHRLAAARVSETSIYLLAEASARIIGILDFRGSDRRRLHHAGDFGVTVAEKWRGRAVGRALVMDMIEWCRKTGIVRKINLAVFAENEAARRLYESLGFVEEGRTSRQVAVDGRFVDEINLGLWIGPTA